MNEPKEREIQKSILDWLRYKKIFCWKNSSVGIYKAKTGKYIPIGMKGISDILGIIQRGKDGGGIFLAIEVKREGCYATENQLKFIDEINKKGGIAFIARNIEDVSEKLKVFL